jgi:hypothetical protein
MRRTAQLLAIGVVALVVSGSAAAARVPDGVTSVRFTAATGITTTVIYPRVVARIVKSFDALPPYAVVHCPSVSYAPPAVRIDFRSASGAVLLRALARGPGVCGGAITFNGHTVAEDGFIARVTSIVGEIDPNPRTAANERFAQRDAGRLLRRVVPPPGSRVLKTPPKQLSTDGIQLTTEPSHGRIWKVHMSLHAVFAFEKAHRPAGSTPNGSGFVNEHGHVSRQLRYAYPAIRNRVWTREVNMNIAPLGHGWTGIRVGAWDEWVLVHDPDEVVPPGVRTIVIRKGPRVVHRVTDQRTVATIVRRFDALAQAPIAGSCAPLMRSSSETISFLGASGQVLAHATAYAYGKTSGVCNPIRFFIGGHAFAPLLGGGFLMRVEKLLR